MATPAPESEIEVTPEMIEAGALELAGFDRVFDTHDEGAVRIFIKMIAARIQ